MSERSVSFTVRAQSQEIIGRSGCFTAAAKNHPCALDLRYVQISPLKENSKSNCNEHFTDNKKLKVGKRSGPQEKEEEK
jgi:hypothetical protein